MGRNSPHPKIPPPFELGSRHGLRPLRRRDGSQAPTPKRTGGSGFRMTWPPRMTARQPIATPMDNDRVAS